MKTVAKFSLVLLATTVSAIFNAPLTKVQHNGSPGIADRSRASLLRSRAADGQTTVPLTDRFYSFTTSVGIGNPPTYYNLQVDTGSSNSLCGIGKPYHRTSTSFPTGQSFNLTSSGIAGIQYLDQVTLAPALTITNQSIGSTVILTEIRDIDGVLGMGPVGLTKNTLSPNTSSTIPTVMNNLVSQGLIKNQIFGIYLAPGNDSDTIGTLTYGGTDPSLYQGEVTYVPVTNTHPASDYWGITVASATYGDKTIIRDSTAGIIDTGTTLILLADDFFQSYLDAIPGAKFDKSLGLVRIPSSSVPLMQPLKFKTANNVLTLDVAAQLFPEHALESEVPGERYGVIVGLGSPSGQGLDFVLGMLFVERYYVVFDTDKSRVGFAQT